MTRNYVDEVPSQSFLSRNFRRSRCAPEAILNGEPLKRGRHKTSSCVWIHQRLIKPTLKPLHMSRLTSAHDRDHRHAIKSSHPSSNLRIGVGGVGNRRV